MSDRLRVSMNSTIADGRLDPDRLASLERLVAEEAALEAEQERHVRRSDRRGARRPR